MADGPVPGHSPTPPPAIARPEPGSRALAWVALALLLLVATTMVILLVVSEGMLVLLVAGVGVAVVVVAATGWWAFTTRRRWKRWLNVVIAGLAAGILALIVTIFSMRFAAALVSLAVFAVAYAEAARRALVSGPAAGEVAPLLRPWLLVNPRSGGGKAERFKLVAAARQRGLDVHLLTSGEDAQALASAAVAAGADALGVAGGDGSLGAVAAVAVRSQLPFVCVPVGTRNHFAADLGLDWARPRAALDALDGHERRVDVGTINGRAFLNNVSIGAYADLVHESTYRANRLGTAHAVLPEMLRSDQARLDINFELPDGQPCADALVLLVANNPYGTRPLEPAGRARLDTGLLQISVLRARTGAKIAAALARVRARGHDQDDWSEWTTSAFRVESPSGEIRAAVDGEAAVLVAPLDFRVWPGALRVLVPTGRRRLRLGDLLAPLRWGTVTRLWTAARTGESR